MVCPTRHLLPLPLDSPCHRLHFGRYYREIPSTSPALITLFRSSEFGKRTGRRGVGGAGWRQLVAGRSLAMVADWLWPLGLCPHDAIRCAGSNACRIGVSNGLLQLFRQPPWDAPKMSLIA